MVIIDKKKNFVHECVSKTRAGEIIGVHRHTVAKWEKDRIQDGTYLEIYNHFEIYFNTTTHKGKPRNTTGTIDRFNAKV